jgi:sulfite reductase (NADPH) flavoprotein alpha-component
MIGPGTGVAPFRAYLQERKVTGAKGKNWLFFGAQHEKCDFAYGDEFNAYMKEGLLLARLRVVTRSTPENLCQHKMTENAAEIWKWIDTEGCFLCVACAPDSRDVDARCGKSSRAGRQKR